MDVRKSASRMTAGERNRFVDALIELKREGHYDHLVHVHHQAMMEINPDPAHGGPAFLPWHRYYLRHLELDLQQVDSSVTIPYWDWTRDRSHSGAPWTDDLMGPNGRTSGDGRVMSGPFAYSSGNWPIVVKDRPRDSDFLARFFVSPRLLPRGRRVRRILTRMPYDSSPWNLRTNPRESFRAALEMAHNSVHNWVGGNMTSGASPNDPVFFLHHAMVDRLWAKWQKLHPTERYKPVTAGPRGHNREDRMWPWRTEKPAVTPKSVLDHHEMGYRYDDEGNW